MAQPVPKEELLAREKRWSVRAGIAALLGSTCFVVSTVILQSAGGAKADTTAELLADYHEHGSSFILANAVGALGFFLFAIPLWFLFTAASGRSELVRRAFLAFAFIGPVLLGAQGLISSFALDGVADDFLAQAPAAEREARADARAEAAGKAGDQGGAKSGESTAERSEATTGADETTETSDTDSTGTETAPESTEDKVTDAREDLADDLVADSGTQKVAIGLLFPGALGMVVGMVYIPLWCMRTGLLTRFWATLGMALGVSLILLGPLGQLLLVIWFAAVGLILIGAWPGGKPPAWLAGEAVPWPKPGEPPPQPGQPAEPLEGSGREVSERPLPEEPPPPDPGPLYGGESQGQRRKKRKRRS